jgi:copper chaperone CopZ
MMTATADLIVSGMSCEGCVSNLTKALKEVPGVSRAEVTLATGKAHVEYDPARTGLAALKEAVEESGYEVVS